MIWALGPLALMAKCDIRLEIVLLTIDPNDLILLGFTFRGTYDKVLLMGCSIH